MLVLAEDGALCWLHPGCLSYLFDPQCDSSVVKRRRDADLWALTHLCDVLPWSPPKVLRNMLYPSVTDKKGDKPGVLALLQYPRAAFHPADLREWVTHRSTLLSWGCPGSLILDPTPREGSGLRVPEAQSLRWCKTGLLFQCVQNNYGILWLMETSCNSVL